jgi:glycosyltransferase involved in cell wall biosynthesis
MLEGRVSVVIPSHDDLATLVDAVASVRAQTLQPAECVVVSDLSRDGTEAWLRRQDDVRWTAIDVGSPATARNVGIGLARGTFVALLDADDLWHPDRLRLADRQVALAPGAALWACSWRREDEPLDTLVDGRTLARRSRRVTRQALFTMNRMQTSTVVVRRSAVLAAGGFDPDRDGAEDWDLWLRLAAAPAALWLADVAMVTYRRGTGRYSHDAARVYRRGLEAIAVAGAGPEAIAWHHLRFAYALGRCGEPALARRAWRAAGAGGRLRRARLGVRFALYLAGRGARRGLRSVRRLAAPGAAVVRRVGDVRAGPRDRRSPPP